MKEALKLKFPPVDLYFKIICAMGNIKQKRKNIDCT